MINLDNLRKTAVLSIDNTQGFENPDLNELYVKEGEKAAEMTKEVVDMCRRVDIKIINIFDNHPLGHVLFSANYKNKSPYESISYEEVSRWTAENNDIGERAGFTLKELQDYLKIARQETLWPDHCIMGTKGAELMPPLYKYDFDYNVPKGEKVVNSGYSGFDNTNLDELLKSFGIENLILTGVATDYCVGQTAQEAIKKGYNVCVINEAVRGVSKDTTDQMINLFGNEGICFITIKELKELLSQ